MKNLAAKGVGIFAFCSIPSRIRMFAHTRIRLNRSGLRAVCVYSKAIKANHSPSSPLNFPRPRKMTFPASCFSLSHTSIQST